MSESMSDTMSDNMSDAILVKHIARIRRLKNDDEFIEAKSAVGGLPKKIWQSVSAFANTNGGYIVLGLDENNNFQTSADFAANKIFDALVSGLNTASKSTPQVQPIPSHNARIVDFEGGQIVVLRVYSVLEMPGALGPCYVVSQGLQSGSYKRVGDMDKHLTEYEIYSFRTKRSHRDTTDREPVPNASLESLSYTDITRLVSDLKFGNSRVFAGLAEDDLRGAMKRINILTGDEQVTFAGYLTLGQYPQQEFPQLTVDVAVHPGLEKAVDNRVRFLDRSVCDGPLPVMIVNAVRAVMRNLKTRRIVNGTGAIDVPEIPEEVLREAITNAVLHRDYSDYVRGAQVSVDIFPDRIEISNPGGFWGDRSVDNISEGYSQSRNENLARLLTLVAMPDGLGRVCENQGSGISLINEAMHQAGLAAPDYSDSGLDRVVLKLWRPAPKPVQTADSRHTGRALGGVQKLVLETLNSETPLSIAEISEITGKSKTSLRPAIRSLIDNGYVQAIGSEQSKNRGYKLL